MKVLLLGAGGQGGPCCSILAHDKSVEEIILGDIDVETARRVASKISDPRIKIVKVDASDVESVANAACGTNVIIDLVTPKFYLNIMEGAAKAKVHYVNTAFDRGLWDYEISLDRKLKFHDEFYEAGMTALIGCGMSSGYSNVIAKYYIDKLDTPKSVKVRLAKKDLSIGKYGDAVTPWNPGWDPGQALRDFAIQSTIFRNGKYEVHDDAFSEIEEWDFPEPFGSMAVSMHAHEEPYSLPYSFAAKGLEYCDFKYYVNMQIAPIVTLGLASDEVVDIGGTKIRPIDVVLSMVSKPSEGFLTENPDTFEYQDENKLVSIMVEVSGIKDDRNQTYLIDIPTMVTPRRKMYETYGTSLINVALPAVIGAKMITSEEVPRGVVFPHDLDANRFLEIMANSGFEHKFHELK